MGRAGSRPRERRSRLLSLRPRRAAGPGFSPSFPNFLPRLARGTARLALAVLLLAGAGVVVAPAAADVLVSNIDQSAANDNDLNNIFNRAATAFTTGNNSLGYTLESIDLVLDEIDGDESFTVTVRTASSNNPGTVHATLTNPTLGDGTRTFTAPSGTTLNAATTYFVHIERTAGSFEWGTTSNNAQDSGGASNWSIANQGYSKAQDNAWNHLNGRSHRFRVNGSANEPCPTANPPAGTIWSACLTVGDIPGFGFGYSPSDSVGALSDNTFTFLDQNYTIGSLNSGPSGDTGISFNRQLPGEAHDWFLQIGDDTLEARANDANVAAQDISWTAGVRWDSGNDGEKHTVRLIQKVPSLVSDLAAEPGDGQVVLSWTAPAFTGASAITGYEYQYSTAGNPYGPWTSTGGGTTTTLTVTGLNNGTKYLFHVRAKNGQGNGGTPFPAASATPRGNVAPAAGCGGAAPSNAFWSACLTVAKGGGNNDWGFDKNIYGALTDKTVTYGNQNYPVDEITLTPSGSAWIYFDVVLPSAAAGWALRIGDTVLNPGEYSHNPDTAGGTLVWSGTGIRWTETEVGKKYRVSLINVGPEPGLNDAVVHGLAVKLGYNTALSRSSQPAPGDFTLTASGGTVNVSSVKVEGSRVLMRLDRKVARSENVTLSYTAGANPVRSLAITPGGPNTGRNVANLTDHPLRNTTPPTDILITGLADSHCWTWEQCWKMPLVEGATGTFKVSLARQPGRDRELKFRTRHGNAVSMSKDGITFSSRISLDFTTANWNTEQTVTVRVPVDDNSISEGLHPGRRSGDPFEIIEISEFVPPGTNRRPGTIFVNVTDDNAAVGSAGGCAGQTPPANAFWSTCLTVGETGTTDYYGYQEGHATNPGAITRTGFRTSPVHGNIFYRISRLSAGTQPAITGLEFEGGANDTQLSQDARDNLTLHLRRSNGNYLELPLKDADSYNVVAGTNEHRFRWVAKSPGWTSTHATDGNSFLVALVDSTPGPLAAVTGLTATGRINGGQREIHLDWTAPAGTVTGYEYRVCAGTVAECNPTHFPEPGTSQAYLRWMPTGSATPGVALTEWYPGQAMANSHTTDGKWSFLVRAVNDRGKGAVSEEVEGVFPCADQTAPSDAFWQACLQVGYSSTLSAYGAGPNDSFGALAPRSFMRAGATHSISAITSRNSANALQLDFLTSPNTAANDWVLQVGSGTPRRLGDATRGGDGFAWTVPGGIWSDSDLDNFFLVSLKEEAANPSQGTAPPGAPPTFDIEPGAGSMTLTWTAPDYDGTITGWQVRYGVFGDKSTAWGEWTDIEGSTAETTSHTVTGLDAESFYAFKVRAMAGTAAGAESTTSAAQPLPAREGRSVLPPSDADSVRTGATALDVAAALQATWYLRDRALDRTAGDEVDYYSFTLTARKTLGLGVRGQSIDLDVHLEDEKGARVASSWPPPVDRDVEWLKTTLAPGTYYVRVEAEEDGATPYYVRFGLTDPPPADTDATRDGATALDAVAAAQSVQYYRNKSLDRAGGDRVDYYSFTLTGRKVLELGIRGQTINLDASVENDTGTTLMRSWPPPRNRSVEWLKMTLDAGTYYIRVEAMENGATPYYVRFGLKDAAASLSVADASAEEGTDATLDFAVTLDRNASATVTVAFATEDGSATAGDDYTARSGTLTFLTGERTKTVSVPVLDDSLNEGEETMTLRLTNPQGASLSDGVATGTISNSDPLQTMWLSRFGHMVGSQIVDEVSDRLARPLEGAQVTVGGRTLDLAQLGDAQSITGLAQAFGQGGDIPLAGTSFHIAFGAESDGPAMVSWGRVASLASTADRSHRAGPVRLDNEVVTGIMGLDRQWSRGIAGVALSLSEGRSSFAQEGVDSGTVEASLTTAAPYAQLRLGEGFHVWGLAGFGTGVMAIRQDRSDRVTRADIEMHLGAVGARGDLMQGEGLNLALKADAFMVQMASDRAANTVATEAETSRMRVMLEASRRFALGRDAALVPGLELGLRQDGGDSESGAGVEIGASLAWAHPASNMEARLNARSFMGQGASGYEEWGVSGSLHVGGDNAGRGFLLSLSPTLGAADGDADRLWSVEDASRLGEGGAFEAAGRFDVELGYGLPAFGLLTGTPWAGLGLSESGREWRLGWRLTPGSQPLDFSLGVEATLTEPANDNARPGHGAMLRGAVRW